MAAVLCGGIGKCIGGCCECIGQTCMLPFKVCGACCDGCGQCCKDSCSVVTNCCSSSFCCYITVTLALNVPPIVVGLADLANIANGCQASYWLLIFWILCGIHIVAAFYMARAVDSDDSILPTQQTTNMSNFDASSGASRMKHLFCYDGWMAVYILVVCGYFVWLLLGAGLFAVDGGAECDSTMGNVGVAYGFGWAFVMCGGCALCCSLCCGMFNQRPANNPNTHFVNTNQQPAGAAQAPQAAAAAAATGAPTDSKTSSTTSKPNPYAASTTTATPITPVSPSAPPEVEVPIASATPIINDNDNVPSTKATPY